MQEAVLQIKYGCRLIKFSESDIQRFWSKIDKDGPLPDQSVEAYFGLDKCWTWNGSVHADGYGAFKASLMSLRAHRVSFAISAMDASPEIVCHRCDNPLCVNPDHLFSGCQRDNHLDSVKKGRNACGERIGISKLTPEEVISIRNLFARGMKRLPIARAFNVNWSTIHNIVSGRTWVRVNDAQPSSSRTIQQCSG